MRITVTMEYWIATILYVGQESTSSRSGKTRYVTIEEISRACGISRNHLNKIVYLLGQSSDAFNHFFKSLYRRHSILLILY